MSTHKQATPVCPHCGHALDHEEMTHQETDLFALAPEEGKGLVVCPLCDKDYWVQGGFKPHYTSAFAEEQLL
jgi:hypothetical protein